LIQRRRGAAKGEKRTNQAKGGFILALKKRNDSKADHDQPQTSKKGQGMKRDRNHTASPSLTGRVKHSLREVEIRENI